MCFKPLGWRIEALRVKCYVVLGDSYWLAQVQDFSLYLPRKILKSFCIPIVLVAAMCRYEQ